MLVFIFFELGSEQKNNLCLVHLLCTGAVAVHGAAGVWGALCVGLFAVKEPDLLVNGGLTRGQCGLFKGCGFRLLGVQALAVACVTLWSGLTTWILLAAIDKITPIRMCIEEEILGADFWIHAIRHDCYDYDSLVQEMLAEGLDISEQLEKIGRIETSMDWHQKVIDKHYSGRQVSRVAANVQSGQSRQKDVYTLPI